MRTSVTRSHLSMSLEFQLPCHPALPPAASSEHPCASIQSLGRPPRQALPTPRSALLGCLVSSWAPARSLPCTRLLREGTDRTATASVLPDLLTPLPCWEIPETQWGAVDNKVSLSMLSGAALWSVGQTISLSSEAQPSRPVWPMFPLCRWAH